MAKFVHIFKKMTSSKNVFISEFQTAIAFIDPKVFFVVFWGEESEENIFKPI